jgi:hypothetical protein
MPSFRPESGENELWPDAWAAVAPCKIGASSTMRPSSKPSGVTSKASKSDSSVVVGTIHSSTTKNPTRSPTIGVGANHTTTTTNPPTNSPITTQARNDANTITPTYSPMNNQSSFNNASDYQSSDAYSEVEQSSSKTVLWTSLAISAAVIVLVVTVLHRCSRSPERMVFFDISKEDETCREMPGASGSMSFQTESGPPGTVFFPGEESTCQPDLFGQSFELLPPSSIYRAQSKVPLPLKCATSPMSMACLAESSFNTKREVIAPPGKLGIILKQSLQGCMIQSVKSDSPMLGILLPDDLILSFNDIVSATLQDILQCNLCIRTHS